MDRTPVLLTGAAVGERWVLRIRLADGSATDVTGWLQRIDAGTVTVVDVSGAERTVRTASVIVARRAPAARGGPDPLRVDVATLEHLMVPSWLAFHEPLGEWTLRAGGGFTGRANSCHCVGDPGLPVGEAADRIVAYAGHHRIPAWAQVVSGSAVEADLRRLGWTDVYTPTDVLVCRLAGLLGTSVPDDRVTVSEELSEQWRELYQRSRPTQADSAVLRLILDGTPPRAFGTSMAGTRPVGIGRAHIGGDWVGFSAIWTEPVARRQGWAGLVMSTLGHWAARRGARYAYLQVESANRAATAAYVRAGFARHHSYRYLAAPPTR